MAAEVVESVIAFFPVSAFAAGRAFPRPETGDPSVEPQGAFRPTKP
jgi:hypothetical protein